jgi:hypothetical protein
VVSLGFALFVSDRLTKPENRDRLVAVAQAIFADETMMGSGRRWVEHPGVKRDLPIGEQTTEVFRTAGALGRGKPTMLCVPEPELVE